MRLHIVSDLHVEFGDITIPYVGADALILAGDIGVGSRHEDWMFELCNRQERVLYLLGNHEYYGQDMADIERFWARFEHPRFRFLQKDVVEVGNIRIAGCTLWTDFKHRDPVAMAAAAHAMNDFSWVRRNGARFRPENACDLHDDHRRWLLEQENIDVVVTHHAPSYQSVTPYWREHGGPMNPAFAANCDDVIERLKPRLWIHGHMHNFIRYWHNGERRTEVLCNPRGYTGREQHTGFDPNLVIEL